MKKFFDEFNIKSEEELDELWAKCVFCFDTSVLFDLYRYSEDTRNAWYRLLEGLRAQLILPNHVVWEYKRNRISQIIDQHLTYQQCVNEIIAIEKRMSQENDHPFFSENALTKAKELRDLLIAESKEKKEYFAGQTKHDQVYEKLSEIFEGKITETLVNREELDKEADERYKKKIPPGYEDRAKPDNAFGDFYIWKQLIEIATTVAKPIVFVTRDEKEDWWWMDKEKNRLGPRVELVKEMLEKGQQAFHLYLPSRFLERGTKYIGNEELDPKIIDEVKELQPIMPKKYSELSSPTYTNLKTRNIGLDMSNLLLKYSQSVSELVKNMAIRELKERFPIGGWEMLNSEQQELLISQQMDLLKQLGKPLYGFNTDGSVEGNMNEDVNDSD